MSHFPHLGRSYLPFELDFTFKLKRARRRSHEYAPPQYPFGKDPLAETNPWRPTTPIMSPVSPAHPTPQFSFNVPSNAQSFAPPTELPDNAVIPPRPQYENSVPSNANAYPPASNSRPFSWGGQPDLPHIFTGLASPVGSPEPGHNRNFQSPISPPASPIGSNELVLLKLFRTVFIVGDSTSMISSSHLKSAYNLLEKIAPLAAKYAEKSVDIQFLSDDKETHTQVIRPGDQFPSGDLFWHGVTARGGATMTAGLKRIIKPYLSGLRKRKVLQKEGLNIIVITDGKRSDRKEVKDYIISVARELTKKGAPQHLVGIQFVQVGDDESAKTFFKAVDDDLEKTHQIRDIVDTVVHTSPDAPLTKDCVEKILLGGISETQDKMKML
ncbi:hypothetical protein TWF481_010226 [Arthrobotrys musiformis]|uniref:VWFA domain-containing protein n=1 Tax=Arthrobotrys musiformis TaxID=47236 RepID=A0AAV9W2Z5_9PEZI